MLPFTLIIRLFLTSAATPQWDPGGAYRADGQHRHNISMLTITPAFVIWMMIGSFVLPPKYEKTALKPIIIEGKGMLNPDSPQRRPLACRINHPI
jgi:hypothetical protein